MGKETLAPLQYGGAMFERLLEEIGRECGAAGIAVGMIGSAGQCLHGKLWGFRDAEQGLALMLNGKAGGCCRSTKPPP